MKKILSILLIILSMTLTVFAGECLFEISSGYIKLYSLDFIPNEYTDFSKYDTAKYVYNGDNGTKPTNISEVSELIRDYRLEKSNESINLQNTKHQYMLQAQSDIVDIANSLGINEIPVPLTQVSLKIEQEIANKASTNDIQGLIMMQVLATRLQSKYLFFKDNGGDPWKIGQMQ